MEAPPWNTPVPRAGNSARGMPKTMALMSMRNTPLQRLSTLEEAEAFDDRPDADLGAAVHGRHRPDGKGGDERSPEGDHIDPVDGRESDATEEDAGHGRAGHRADLDEDLPQGIGLG